MGTLTDLQEQLEELRVIFDTALDLPSRGTNIGGGMHVDAPATWDGTGDCPPGWTRTAAEAFDNGAGAYAMQVPPGLVGKLDTAKNNPRLSPQQRGKLISALATLGLPGPPS
jgi:hypothetical protein